jgi:Tol biopolymer transport system component
MTLVPGTRLGPYEILSLIGAGGMGEVYEAKDARLGRRVALKVLPAAEAGDERSRERLIQEARAAAQLDHPHICTVYEVGEQNGHAFIAMQLVEGETLDRRMRRGPLSIATIVGIARQVAEALAAAHARGIVHRDIKPQNVMISSGDYVRVLDFGLAKSMEPANDSQDTVRRLTATGLVAGTVPYMSPEQLRGEPVDARSDIFSFGTLLYEMATRAHPFAGGNSADTTSAILTRDPVAADFPAPPELRRIVRKCLEKDRDRRYQSTRDLVVDLDHFSRDDVPLAPAVSKRRVPWIPIGMAAAFLLAAGVFAYWRTASPSTSPTPVQLTDFPDSAVSPSFSRDGTMVTFIRSTEYFMGPGQIYVKTLPNGEPLQLTNDPSPKYGPTFSPDGRRIAYTMIGDPVVFDTWTVPVTGGPPTKLLPNAAGLAWIDDQHVVFGEIQAGTPFHMGIVTATESRGDARPIYLPAHERAMAHYSYPSPDGKWLIVVEMNRLHFFDPCRVLPVDGKSTGHQVGPQGQCLLAGWSTDGRTMYFSAEVAGARHLWRQAFPDGAVERIDLGAATEEEGVAIDPNGRSLITSIGHHQSWLSLHGPDGDKLLSSEGEEFLQPITSADGAWVYFLSRRSAGQRLELKRMDIASRRLELLVPDREVIDYDLSRDEKWIAFTTPTRSGPEVWKAPIDHSIPAARVVANASDVQFGAHDDLIVVVREGTSNALERIDLDGRRTHFDMTPGLDAGVVSSDGRWVIEMTGPFAIRAMPIYGGTPLNALCTNDPCQFRWSRKGDWLYATWTQRDGSDHTAAIPLRAGEAFPPAPAGTEDKLGAWLKLPGVRHLENADVSPGPDPSTYVFRKTTQLTNLFRVPIGRQ